MRLDATPAPVLTHSPGHCEYPFEQMARSKSTAFQIGFARMTMYLLPYVHDVALEACEKGLRIFAASEVALRFAEELIRQIHEDDIEFGAPQVRLSHYAPVSPESGTTE